MSIQLDPSRQIPRRAITLLSLAAFAQQTLVRVTDSLLPQIASEFSTTVGAAAVVAAAYTLTHGSVQLVVGPIGDRLGKYRTVTIACGICSLLVLFSAFTQSLSQLAVARLSAGAMAAFVIPISMAFIGDVVPYEQRQEVLGRYLSGIMMGQLFGQAAGGILGDLFGWRAVFFLIALLLALAFAGLLRELAANPVTRAPRATDTQSASLLSQYSMVLRDPWARKIMLIGLIECGLMFGMLPFIGADLRLRFGLSYTAVGLIVACFAIGGLLYSATVHRLLALLGQQGMARGGGMVLGGTLIVLALQPVWWFAPAALVVCGFGFFMLHGTLQTTATQMTPAARGTAVGLFSSSLYFGQTLAISAAAPIVDLYGAPVIFLAAAIVMPAIGFLFAYLLRRRGGRHA